eukprot:15344639-Ditylum_brightwellii.AAC.1
MLEWWLHVKHGERMYQSDGYPVSRINKFLEFCQKILYASCCIIRNLMLVGKVLPSDESPKTCLDGDSRL